MNRLSSFATFALPVLAGLAAVVWVGAGYGAAYPLALAVTAVIAAFFIVGVVELWRYRQGTHSLVQAVDALQAPPTRLADWLGTLHPALRQAVRGRVEGQRAALPAPALTPYLAGLLVLLGMLGTFAGMVVTLRGTGMALESATDLATVRASLAAPVKGLGVAFGTSLAGVATSAMLGLLSALARRERLLAGQQLDARISGPLRAFSPAHQRDEAFLLMQRQADALPLLAERLQTLAIQLEQQHGALAERLQTGQERFHQQAETAYAGLARSVDRSLRDSLADSARQAGAALQPAVEATLAGLAREAGALQSTVSAQVQDHLAGMAQRFDAHSEGVARHWDSALAAQRQSHEAMATQLGGALAAFSDGFAQRSAQLVEQVTAQLADTTGGLTQQGHALLAQQADAGNAQAERLQRQLSDAATQFEQHTAQLLQGAQQALAEGQAQGAERDTARLAAWTAALTAHEETTQLHTRNTQQALASTAERFEQQVGALHEGVAQAHATLQAQAAERDAQQLAAWTAQLAQHTQVSEDVATRTQAALADSAARFAEQAELMNQNADQRYNHLRKQLSEQEQHRLAAWQQTLTDTAAQLHQQWQQTGAEGTRQQQAILAALADTTQTMAAQSASQAQGTVAEIGRLLDAAAAAPRAAAEVIGELRDKLTDSMARDNAMLDERARVMQTLGTLLDAVNHASTEQRQAIDQLVGGSAEVLERTANRFAERMEADSGRLAEAAAQIGAGATEIASLGDAFGQAVQAFGESNAQLTQHLQQLDATLAQSIARSDEQLAYYVAQAREVIDLSLSSQQQIVGDLQRLARERAAEGAAA